MASAGAHDMPVLGRWASVDPALRDPGFAADSPLESNGYGYAAGDPLNLVDETGTSVWTKVVEVAKEIYEKGSAAAAFADTVADVRTLASDDATALEKGIAAASLLSEAAPVGLRDLEKVGNAATRIKAIDRLTDKLAGVQGTVGRRGAPAIPGGSGRGGGNGLSPRAARRQAMREAGIPTSQQPVRQSSPRGPGNRPAGRHYVYEVLKEVGGTKIMLVQHSLTDRVPGHGPHWELGAPKRREQIDWPCFGFVDTRR